MKAAIVLDDWKLSIFTQALDDAGFAYEQSPGVTSDTVTLSVSHEPAQLAQLSNVVWSAQADAAKSKRN